MPLVTKIFKFCAAHQYSNPSWDLNKNIEVFGKDHRIHGHNYDLEITVTGKINDDTGFLVDLGDLKKVVNEKVVNLLDHSTIDQDIEWFKQKQPSTENLVIWIWNQIVNDINVKLYRVRLKETPTIYTDYFGEDIEI